MSSSASAGICGGETGAREQGSRPLGVSDKGAGQPRILSVHLDYSVFCCYRKGSGHPRPSVSPKPLVSEVTELKDSVPASLT